MTLIYCSKKALRRKTYLREDKTHLAKLKMLITIASRIGQADNKEGAAADRLWFVVSA